MTGHAVHILLRSLSDAEAQRLGQLVSGVPESHVLLPMVTVLRSMDQFDESQLFRQIGVSSRGKKRHFQQLAMFISHAIGHNDQELQMQQHLVTAKAMILRLANEPATQLLQEVMEYAVAHERFDLLMNAHQLREMMTSPFEWNSMTAEQANIREQNRLQYQAIVARLRQLAGLHNAADNRDQMLQAIATDPLMAGPTQALSIRGTFLYWKAQAGLAIFSGQYLDAQRAQEKLLALLQQHRWLVPDGDFFLIREYRPLAFIHTYLHNDAALDRVLFQVANIPTQHPRTELAKYAQLYPLRIGRALQNGDGEAGLAAVEQVRSIITTWANHLPTRFITENLYYCAYMLIAAGQIDDVPRLLTELGRYRQTEADFLPRIIPMVRLLQIVLAHESRDEAEARRLCKNYRATRHYGASDYLDTCISVLNRLTITTPPQKLRQYTEKLSAFADDRTSHYFDMGSWLQSRLEHIPMIQVMARKASQNRPTGNQAAG